MKGLVIALQFMTRLPTPRLDVSREEFAASICFFPAVGLIIGAVITAAAWVATPVSTTLSALIALTLWTAITGALHLDGLGDIADASGAAHKDSARLSAVLADPHVGSFAVTAITLQLISKALLLHALIEQRAFLAILLIPAAARLGPLVWSKILPSLHAGLGDMFRPYVRWWHIGLWSALLALGAMALSPSIILAVPIFLIWAVWIRRKIGGINGDGHGGGIEVSESLLLASALIWAHFL